MDLIQKYEKMINNLNIKLLKLSIQGKHNSAIANNYRNAIDELEIRMQWCQKYGYPYNNREH